MRQHDIGREPWVFILHGLALLAALSHPASSITLVCPPPARAAPRWSTLSSPAPFLPFLSAVYRLTARTLRTFLASILVVVPMAVLYALLQFVPWFQTLKEVAWPEQQTHVECTIWGGGGAAWAIAQAGALMEFNCAADVLCRVRLTDPPPGSVAFQLVTNCAAVAVLAGTVWNILVELFTILIDRACKTRAYATAPTVLLLCLLPRWCRSCFRRSPPAPAPAERAGPRDYRDCFWDRKEKWGAYKEAYAKVQDMPEGASAAEVQAAVLHYYDCAGKLADANLECFERAGAFI